MIINSLLQNDLYKYAMQQVVFHHFSGADVEYEFVCRSGENLRGCLNGIAEAIDEYCTLKLQKEELDYLRDIPYFKKDFIDFLELYQPNRKHIILWTTLDQLKLKIVGPWLLTILHEVPLLAIINEVCFRHTQKITKLESRKQFGESNAYDKLAYKIALAKATPNFKFADFGTRRRYSALWQDFVVKTCSENLSSETFVGTSNVYLAKKYNIKPIGTMAHEFICAGMQIGVRVRDSQKYMLQKWVDEYRGSLGIALTDTIGIDAFLKDFDLYFSKLYDGVRHDSGCPYEWARKVCKHYKDFKIDPNTKSLVFSDGLDFEKAVSILTYCKETLGTTNVSFGIGTNLTNDIPETKPLSIVIKMQKCNGQPVAKISDEPGKAQCQDPEFLSYLKKVFEVK